jgi:predicted component of type VI protein secretion system
VLEDERSTTAAMHSAAVAAVERAAVRCVHAAAKAITVAEEIAVAVAAAAVANNNNNNRAVCVHVYMLYAEFFRSAQSQRQCM